MPLAPSPSGHPHFPADGGAAGHVLSFFFRGGCCSRPSPIFPYHLYTHAVARLLLVVVGLGFTVQEPGVADAAADGYARWFVARLKLLTAALADGREFLCAGRFTLSDVAVAFPLIMAGGLRNDGRPLSSFFKPAVAAYLARLKARPAFCAMEAHEQREAARSKL